VILWLPAMVWLPDGTVEHHGWYHVQFLTSGNSSFLLFV
jgi:hypothetical protein